MRVREAIGTNARIIATECPFCIKMLEQGAQQVADDVEVVVKDIAEIVAEALVPEPPPPETDAGDESLLTGQIKEGA